MYNGIGLTTARGTGTNGYVQRNLSAIRKTKEKIVEYQEKGDTAVRPFDKSLIEHDRRRQAEVRCLELREMLEEDGLPEDKIEDKVSAFRKKLLEEKKSGIPNDVNGRPILRDSHELSMAQEAKNEKAKSAFGIREDFIPGSSMKEKIVPAESTTPALEEQKSDEKHSSSGTKSDKDKKSKKSKKRHASSSPSSSSSSSSSSDDEERRKKRRKKEKRKKSKKSHHSHKRHHHKKGEEAPRSLSRDKDRHRSSRR